GSGSSRRSSGLRCIKLSRTRRAKARAFCPACASRSKRKAISAGDLDAHGVLAGAEKAADLEGLLDPAKDQLDRPSARVEIGNLLGRGVEIVRQDAQHLAAIELDADLAHRVLEEVVAPAAPCSGQGQALPRRQVADVAGAEP